MSNTSGIKQAFTGLWVTGPKVQAAIDAGSEDGVFDANEKRVLVETYFDRSADEFYSTQDARDLFKAATERLELPSIVALQPKRVNPDPERLQKAADFLRPKAEAAGLEMEVKPSGIVIKFGFFEHQKAVDVAKSLPEQISVPIDFEQA
jgi:hypothetical protein